MVITIWRIYAHIHLATQTQTNRCTHTNYRRSIQTVSSAYSDMEVFTLQTIVLIFSFVPKVKVCVLTFTLAVSLPLFPSSFFSMKRKVKLMERGEGQGLAGSLLHQQVVHTHIKRLRTTPTPSIPYNLQPDSTI